MSAEKQAELVRLEAELAAGRSYLRFVNQRIEAAEQRCGDEQECTDPVIVIRRLIREAGRPLYIDDILRGLDRPLNRDGREEIRHLLLSWVRREEIFTRPRPAATVAMVLEAGQR